MSESRSQLITTPFDASSTAAQVADGLDLHGKRAVVTGSSSGIGVETARALAAQGAEVTLAIRNLASGQRVADSIAKGTGISVLVTHVDLTELASVQRFTAAWDGPLHILINNAGVMAPPSRELRRCARAAGSRSVCRIRSRSGGSGGECRRPRTRCCRLRDQGGPCGVPRT
jgi:hypothetical protein